MNILTIQESVGSSKLVTALKDTVKAAVVPESGTEGAFDLTFRIRGVLKKGESYEQAVPASIPWQRILAVALSKCNRTTREAIEEVIVEAIENPTASDLDAEIKKTAEAAVKRIVGATVRPCEGKTTFPEFLVEKAESNL